MEQLINLAVKMAYLYTKTSHSQRTLKLAILRTLPYSLNSQFLLAQLRWLFIGEALQLTENMGLLQRQVLLNGHNDLNFSDFNDTVSAR
jgi:hypothetical protein